MKPTKMDAHLTALSGVSSPSRSPNHFSMEMVTGYFLFVPPCIPLIPASASQILPLSLKGSSKPPNRW